MAKRVQLRRGTTAQHAAFTGAVGEATVNTETGALHVHDGATPGGIPQLPWAVPKAAPGTQDNTAALEDALGDLPPGGTLFLPLGQWRHTGLTRTTTLRLIGAGPGTSLFNTNTSGGVGFDLDGRASANAEVFGWEIANMQMAALENSGDLLQLQACHHGRMSNVLLPSGDAAAVRLRGCILNTFISVQPSLNLPFTIDPNDHSFQRGFVLDGSNGGWYTGGSHANIFLGCSPEAITEGDGYGYHIADGDSNLILGGATEGNRVGVKFGAGTHHNILATYMELNTVANYELTAPDTTLGTNLILPFAQGGDATLLYQLLAGAGSQALPSIGFQGNPGNGLFSIAADSWAAVVAGARALEFGASAMTAWKSIVPETSVAGAIDLGATNGFNFRRLYHSSYLEGFEIANPGVGPANSGRLYYRDNGSGKTQLVVQFATGAVQVIATEP